MKSICIFLLAFLLLPLGSVLGAETIATGQTYYVDVNGLGGPCSDSNLGTSDRPWQTALKAFCTARPGDTVIFRRGIYRLPRTILTSDLALNPTKNEPITFKALKGEESIITVLRPVAANQWKQITTTKSGKPIFAAPSGDDGRVTNLTQNGVPLTRAPTDDPRYPHRDTSPDAITGPGEWASSLRDHRVMICTTDGNPPGNSVELCDVRGGDGAGNLIDLQRDAQDRCRNLRLVFDNLAFETGYYGFTIRTGFVELRHCVLRKSFGDLINTLSGRIVVDGCDFSAFGESAIDVTGPGDGPQPSATPLMVIRNSQFHDNSEVLSPAPKRKGYNAIMLKGGCADIVVEGNQFYNLRVTLGALTLGGSTAGGPSREGIRLTARNNTFRNISGNQIVNFAGSEDCRFVNNLVCNCNADELVFLGRAGSSAATGSVRPVVQNNIFYRNGMKHDVVSVSPSGAAEGLVLDHNLIAESGDKCRIDDVAFPLKDLTSHGFQVHGVNQPPTFRDFSRHDFHPAPDSPAIDRGADLRTLVPIDADGVARPQGQAFDIGPFEQR